MGNEIDRLEIAVETEASKANRALSGMEKHLDKIADGLEKVVALTAGLDFGKFDLGGFEKARKEIDNLFQAQKKLSRAKVSSPRINRSDLKYTEKSLDDIYDKFKEIGNGIDLSGMGLPELQRGLKDAESQAKRLNDRLEKKIAMEGTDKLGKSWESLVYDIQKATNEAEGYREAIDKIKKEVPRLKIARGENTSSNIDDSEAQRARYISPESLNYDPDAMRMVFGEGAEELKNFNDVMDMFKVNASEAGNAINDFEGSMDTEKVNTYEAQIKRLRAELANLASQGFKQGNAEYDNVAKELARVTAEKKKYDRAMKDSAETDVGLKKADKSLKSIRKDLKSVKNEFSKMGKTAANAFKGAVNTLGEMKKLLTGTQKQANKGMSWGRMIGSSVAFSFVFQGISMIQRAIKEGSDNLAQYSAEYNQSISSMVTALLYMKNAWAAAFAPIVNVVAPYIDAFVSMIARALNAVGQFMATLTGSGFVVQAKKVWKDYATGLGDVSSGADDAAKSIKDLQNYTLGIDELNVIQPSDPASGGSGGSGSGSGGSEIDPSDMFETIKTEGAVASFAKRLKEAFLAEDWKGLGNILADGVNTGLQKLYDVISWDNVGPKITKFTRAFTRTFNSLVDDVDWDFLGKTVGAGVNTVVNTLNSLITGTDWKNLGKSFATGIMGIVDKVNWRNLGSLIGNKFMISWNTFYGFVKNLDFADIGYSISVGFNGAIASIDLRVIGSGLGTLVSGLLDMFAEFAINADWKKVGDSIADGINSFFNSFNFSGLAKALNAWINGLAKALKNAVLKIDWGDVFRVFTDFVGSLEIDTAFLVGIPAVSKLKKAIDEVDVKAFTDGFKKLKILFKGNFFGNLKAQIKNVQNQMNGLQKGVIGTAAVFTEFSLAKDAFYDITSGGENVVVSLGKIAAGAGIAAGALKLVGLSNPFTAIITGATVAIAGLVGVNQAIEEQKQELAEQEQIKLYGDTLANITEETNQLTESIKKRAEEAQKYVQTAGLGEIQMASDLADKYFALSQKEQLTNAEKEEMQRLAGALVDTVPELETYYNTQTGLLDATRDSIQGVIDQRLREIQLSAIEDKLKEAYQDQADAMLELKERTDDVNTSQEKMNGLQEDYNNAWNDVKDMQRYLELKDQIENATGATDDLIAEQDELIEKLTDNGAIEMPAYDTLLKKYEDASTALQDFQDDYNTVMENFATSQEALDAAGDSVESLSEMLSDGMVGAAEDGAKGFAESFSKDTLMQDASYQQALDTYEAFRKGIDAHSPSRKFEQSAEDSISGYVVGVKKGEAVALSAVSGLAKSIAQTFNGSLSVELKNIASELPSYFATSWSSIQIIFSPAPLYFKVTFASAYNSVKSAFQFMDSWFKEKWIGTQNVFKDVKSFFRSGFQSAYDSVKSIWNGLPSFFKQIASNAFKPIKTLINGIIKGVNWVLTEVDSDTRVSEWGGVAFAKGSDGVPRDTLGMVNDQKGATYKELIVPPNGNAFVPDGRNVILPLQKGTQIMPARQTKELMSSMRIPRFARGIGSLMGWSTRFSGDVMDYLDKPDEITKIAIDKYASVSRMTGVWQSMAKGIVGSVFGSASSFIGKIFEKVIPKVDYKPSGGVEQWRALARKALQMTNQYSDANLNLLLYQMQTESGGNPKAINNWDVNAKNGTPSKGLMQVIDPTFKANAFPGYDKNIWDPLSNMLAAIRYTVGRYGSLANGWKGHGYATGGFPRMGEMFFARERGPELVGKIGNRNAVVNNDQIVASVSAGVAKALVGGNDRIEALLAQILDYQERLLQKDTSLNVDGKRMDKQLSKARRNTGYNFGTT